MVRTYYYIPYGRTMAVMSLMLDAI
jgi:hypothetical protein